MLAWWRYILSSRSLEFTEARGLNSVIAFRSSLCGWWFGDLAGAAGLFFLGLLVPNGRVALEVFGLLVLNVEVRVLQDIAHENVVTFLFAVEIFNNLVHPILLLLGDTPFFWLAVLFILAVF